VPGQQRWWPGTGHALGEQRNRSPPILSA